MALGCFDRRPLEIHFCRAEQFSLDGELLDFFSFYGHAIARKWASVLHFPKVILVYLFS